MIVFCIVNNDNLVLDAFFDYETAIDILNSEFNCDDELFPCHDYRIVVVDLQDFIDDIQGT